MNKNEVYQQFLKDNPSTGILKVQIFMAEQAIPIPNVNITIEKEVSKIELNFFEGITDESGIISNIILPAPDIKNIDEPEYVTYELIVKHPNYLGPTTFQVPIYSGQKMIQYVTLVPKPKENKNG